MMTPKELAEILEEINNDYGWGCNMYTHSEEGKKSIKYVDTCFDTRDGKIWRVCFRDVIGGTKADYAKDGVVFAHAKCNKETILKWLRSINKEDK